MGVVDKFPISEYTNLWVHVFLSHWVETLFVGLLNAKEEAWIERETIVSSLHTLLVGLINKTNICRLETIVSRSIHASSFAFNKPTNNI